MIYSSLLMAGLVCASNLLVEFPMNDWLTWGAFVYPFTYLVTELTNRRHGASRARRVVFFGFVVAVLLSFLMLNKRVAAASLFAFLFSQLLDISIFSKLRKQASWWVAPAVASFFASFLDTSLFFFIAFSGTDFPWITVAAGDFLAKCGIDLGLLLPFRFCMRRLPPAST